MALWALKRQNSVTNWLLLALVSLSFIFIILGTLARGAWIALAITTLLILVINRQWLLMIISALTCVLLLIGATNLPTNPIVSKLLQHKLTQMNDGLRFDGGTQGSALDLILEQPIKGYGYGNQLYHNIYNERVKDHPNWIFKRSIGPHNVFLAFWFAGGILGLFGILYFCSSIIAQGIQLIRKNQGVIRQASLVLLMSFLSVYVLRGLFENAYINQVGILVGLMLALRYSLLNYQSVTSSDKQQ